MGAEMMTTDNDSPLLTIPEPCAVRAALARNLREARLLRRLLRLAQVADQERCESAQAVASVELPRVAESREPGR
jgi:hypothetical protein